MITIKDHYPVIDQTIQQVKDRFGSDSKIAVMFENCISNTLQTTIKVLDDGSIFVITGDIPAMWLRDSACQLRPFLFFAKEDPEIADIISGLIQKQMQCIQIDPYANAFNECANGNCWEHDKTDMKPELWERKFEIDSLCFPVQLSYLFWKNTGYTAHFTMDWLWSGFRPSDDSCTYGYLIPSNMLASVILENISEIAEQIYHDSVLAAEAHQFSSDLRKAIESLSIVPGQSKEFYAYEIDGFGEYNIMDDANLPSLLSLPYIGYCDRKDGRYLNTREIILSDRNPYYYAGACAKGIGSPHTPARYIWHIGLAMQALTTTSAKEREQLLDTLTHTDAGTDLMHEAFLVDDPAQYTRPWFSWANSVFCELILDCCGYHLEM